MHVKRAISNILSDEGNIKRIVFFNQHGAFGFPPDQADHIEDELSRTGFTIEYTDESSDYVSESTHVAFYTLAGQTREEAVDMLLADTVSKLSFMGLLYKAHKKIGEEESLKRLRDKAPEGLNTELTEFALVRVIKLLDEVSEHISDNLHEYIPSIISSK